MQSKATCERLPAMATEADGAGWVLPEKWTEELVDEKGEKLSKR